MDDWKRSFADKVRNVQGQWVKQFETKLDADVIPAFDDLASFVRSHGFSTSVPLREEGRRSFKFELAENAYLLLIFRTTGIGEFELRTEAFAPGREPKLEKTTERINDLNEEWTREQIQKGLDGFMTHLGEGDEKAAVEESAEEFVSV